LSIELDLNVTTDSCQGRPVATSQVKEHTVRRIINSTYISLDGIIQDPPATPQPMRAAQS
jgi:hypothetical protein